MKQKIVLLAGTADDDNRDYLPEKLKESEIVVNENGNNSQVYPKGLKEYSDVLSDGVTDTWYEYVPDSYHPDRKTPLVVSLHGGLMTGWGQAVYTSWTLVADREGFIVVFPNAFQDRIWMLECDWEKVEKTMEMLPPEVPKLHKPELNVEDYHDIKKIAALIEHMKQVYNIDAGRVYLQGMSMGNAVTSQFARYLGHLLAGAAGSGCPTNTKLLFHENGGVINKAGALAVWQSRLELDHVPPHYEKDDRGTVLGNCRYWNFVNEAAGVPKIQIRGDYNFAFFEGKKGCTVLLDVKNRDHGQTFDDAELVWDYLFSGCYKDQNGVLNYQMPDQKRKGDYISIAAAEGCKNAWVHNQIVSLEGTAFLWNKVKYHGLNGNTKIRGSYLYVPIRFLANQFCAQLTETKQGESAELFLEDGTKLQFAKGNIGCVINNRIEAMSCEAVEREGMLYLSLEWFLQRFYQMHTSFCEGVLYATDHPAFLSRHMAYLLQDLLGE